MIGPQVPEDWLGRGDDTYDIFYDGERETRVARLIRKKDRSRSRSPRRRYRWCPSRRGERVEARHGVAPMGPHFTRARGFLYDDYDDGESDISQGAIIRSLVSGASGSAAWTGARAHRHPRSAPPLMLASR